MLANIGFQESTFWDTYAELHRRLRWNRELKTRRHLKGSIKVMANSRLSERNGPVTRSMFKESRHFATQ